MKRPLWNGRRAQRRQWLVDVGVLLLVESWFGAAANERAGQVLRAEKDARRLRRLAAARAR